MKENQKNPEKIATHKGQNIQNLENTKRRSEELQAELEMAEKKFNLINENLGEIQEKLSSLRENKARNEATVEGINNRKKDLMYSVKNELGIESDSNLFASSDLIIIDEKNFLALKIKKKKLRKQKKEESYWFC